MNEKSGGDNATLVQSNCATFSGAEYATGSSDAVHDGESISCKFIFKISSFASDISLGGKYNTGANQREITTYISSVAKNFSIFYSSVGTNSIQITHSKVLDLNEWYTVCIDFTATGITISVNDDVETFSYGGVLFSGTGDLQIGASGTSTRKFNGELAYFKMGTAEFNLAEGAGSKFFNTGTAGGVATITGAVLTTLRAGRQDLYHYNVENGFDLWEHATLAPIFAPIGTTVTESGYTFTSTNPAGKWHNGAETGINFPASLSAIVASASVPQPLYYADFEEDFDEKHQVFSNIEDNKKRMIIFYSVAQSGVNLTRIYKCIKKSDDNEIDNVVFDSDNVVFGG